MGDHLLLNLGVAATLVELSSAVPGDCTGLEVATLMIPTGPELGQPEDGSYAATKAAALQLVSEECNACAVAYRTTSTTPLAHNGGLISDSDGPYCQFGTFDLDPDSITEDNPGTPICTVSECKPVQQFSRFRPGSRSPITTRRRHVR